MKDSINSLPISRLFGLLIAAAALLTLTGCPKSISVTGVRLDKTSLSIVEGQTAVLTATVEPSDATVPTISWTSSDVSVATVNSGTVTALKVGQTTITATAEGGHSASCAVTVTRKLIPPTSVELVRSDEVSLSERLFGGQTIQVKVKYHPLEANIDTTFTITTDDPGTPVEKGGFIHVGDAVNDRSFKIIATNGGATKGALVFEKLIRSSKERFLIGDDLGVGLGKCVQPDEMYSFNKGDEFNVHYVYRSDSSDVADNDVSGKVKISNVPPAYFKWFAPDSEEIAETPITKSGTASTALCEFHRNSDGSLHVKMLRNGRPSFSAATVVTGSAVNPNDYVYFNNIPVDSIVLNYNALSLAEEMTAQLTATVYPGDAYDKGITWNTSDGRVATVTGEGFVKAVSAGNATITAISNSNGSVLAKCELTVEVRLKGFDLNPKEMTLQVGKSGQLTAVTNPASFKVNWASSDESIATVDQTGLVTAHKVGSTTIDAMIASNALGNMYGLTSKLTVVPAEVTGIKLSKDSLRLVIGSSEKLAATVLPEGYADQKVSWSSSNPNNVSVDDEGLVTALAPGDATITALASDGKSMASCYVFAMQPVTKINVFFADHRDDKTTMFVGERVGFGCSYEPADANVGTDLKMHTEYEHISTAIHLDENNELVWSAMMKSARGYFKDVVYAENSDKLRGELPIYGTQGMFNYSSKDGSINEDAYQDTTFVDVDRMDIYDLRFKHAILDINGNGPGTAPVASFAFVPDGLFNWVPSLENTTQSIESDGSMRIQFLKEGTAAFKAEVGSLKELYPSNPTSYSRTIIFRINHKAIPVVRVDVVPTEAFLTIGDTIRLSATVSPEEADNKTLTWESKDLSVAKVSENGLVTAVGEGKAYVIATSPDGPEGYCVVTVRKRVVPTGIKLDKTSETIAVGGNGAMLTATVIPDDAEDKSVTWSSSNPNVVTVENANMNNLGFLTAVSPGEADITVTTNVGGFVAVCTVTVTQPVTGIKLNKNQTSLMATATEQLTATVTPSDATEKEVSWVSSNVSVAKVDQTGLITAVAPGEASITATTKDGGFSSMCLVTVGINVPDDNFRASLLDKTTRCDVNSDGVISISEAAALKTLAVPQLSISSLKGLEYFVGLDTLTCFNNSLTDIDVSKNTALTYFDCSNCNLSKLDISKNVKLVNFRCNNNHLTSLDVSKDVDLALLECLYNELGSLDISHNKSLKRLECYGNEMYALDASSMASHSDFVLFCGIQHNESNTEVRTLQLSLLLDQKDCWEKQKENPLNRLVNVSYKDYVAVTGIGLDNTSWFLANTYPEPILLTATITPANPTNKEVSWSCDNADIFDLDPVQGTLSCYVSTPKKTGIAHVTVTSSDGGYTATCTLTVWQSTTSIRLDKDTLNMRVGDARQLTATALPADAKYKEVEWSSSDPSKATVSSTGVVTAVAASSAGPVIITATNPECAVSASCQVYISPALVHVTGISLDQTSVTMYTDDIENRMLTATIAPADAYNKEIVWTCDNTNVVWIKESGANCAFGPGQVAGTATITATTVDGSKTATCTVNVLQAVAVQTVTLFKDNTTTYADSLQMPMNKSRQLYAVVSPTNATTKKVTWSSSNTAVATVSASGLVTSVGTGSATITATSNNGVVSNSCDVTVPNAATGISLDSHSLTVSPTSSSATYLTAAIIPANAFNYGTISWSCSDADAAGASVINLADTNTANQKMLVVNRGLWNQTAGNVVTITVSVIDYYFNRTYTDQCVVNVPAAN